MAVIAERYSAGILSEPLEQRPRDTIVWHQYPHARNVFARLEEALQIDSIIMLFDTDATVRNQLKQASQFNFGKVPEDMLEWITHLHTSYANLRLANVTNQPAQGHQVGRWIGSQKGYTPAPYVFSDQDIPVFGSPGKRFAVRRYKRTQLSVNQVSSWVERVSQEQNFGQIWYVGDSGSDEIFFKALDSHLAKQGSQTQNHYFSVPKWWW